jgi:hypothetical protein
VLFRVPKTPRALYANAETNNQAINTRILNPHISELRLWSHRNEGNSRIDPADDNEPLDDVTPLEALLHGAAVGAVGEGCGGCRADEEEDLRYSCG